MNGQWVKQKRKKLDRLEEKEETKQRERQKIKKQMATGSPRRSFLNVNMLFTDEFFPPK